MSSTLAVFDFDGTLFRSPLAPSWAAKGWFSDEVSLEPPCVPEKPGPEWWVSSTVREARKAIADPDTWAVMVTGRLDRPFRWRVPELLKGAGLNFDEVHLSPGGGGEDPTGRFKRQALQKILKRYPFIRRVELWDDNQGLLSSYIRMLGKAGYEVIPHLVRAKLRDPDCSPEDMGPMPSSKRPVYVRVVLESPETLLQWWQREVGELLPTTHANHMTIKFKPSPEDLAEYELGARVSIRVNGWADNGKVQAVSVDPGPLKVDKEPPHVTVATGKRGSPKQSNRLLAEGITPADGPTLSGWIGVSDNRRTYFKVEGQHRMARRVAASFLVASR
ncbi:MAG: HAD domain-containing protein, partial [Planctomycetota bacterium]